MRSPYTAPPPSVAIRTSRVQAMTLVETMFALLLLVACFLGFLGTFLQSRRTTEASVIHAAATSVVYGIIEQMKMIPLVDPSDRVTITFPNIAPPPAPPWIKIRLSQDKDFPLNVVYTAAPATPVAPTTTPAPSATAASVGAIDNELPELKLSTVAGTGSQPLKMHIWVWIDDILDPDHDANQAKRVTIIYTYTYSTGNGIRTHRDREVFVRTL
jgi:Tfp pilus assembly protein PilV